MKTITYYSAGAMVLLAATGCLAGTAAAKLSIYTKTAPVQVLELANIASLGFADNATGVLQPGAEMAAKLEYIAGPVQSYFLVHGKPGSAYSIQVFGIDGALVFSHQGNYGPAGLEYVPLAKLEAGLYYAYHKDGGVTTTRTITTMASAK